MSDQESNITIAALYQFADLGEGCDRHRSLREPVYDFMVERDIKGTLLIAHEGVNGTVAGTSDAIADLLAFLRNDALFAGKLDDLEVKFAHAEAQPFLRLKVRLKKEIVTMGAFPFLRDDDQPDLRVIDPTEVVGTYVEPEDWNALIDDPDVTLIDTRNEYEVAVGTFKKADGQKAIDPQTDTFREFPQYVDDHLDPAQHTKVAMFCTGGIRCEKATAYLKQRGFENVYHLKGGILKYLETIKANDSRWEGECYVFDRRVTVDHNLQPGSYRMCYACGRPVGEADVQHEHYAKGVSCPTCFDEYTDEQRARFAERQKQMELAKAREDVGK